MSGPYGVNQYRFKFRFMVDAQMKIRLPRSLKGKIYGAAKTQGRTMNAEIVARLERTFIEDAEREAGISGRDRKAIPKYPDIRNIKDRLGTVDELVERLEFVEKRLAELEKAGK